MELKDIRFPSTTEECGGNFSWDKEQQHNLEIKLNIFLHRDMVAAGEELF